MGSEGPGRRQAPARAQPLLASLTGGHASCRILLATKSLLNHYQFASDCETEGQLMTAKRARLLAKHYLFDSTMKVVSVRGRRTNALPKSSEQFQSAIELLPNRG